MTTEAELPPMDGGLDAFWAAMATRTTAGGDHPFATLSAVMKVYLLMPHSDADSERVFSMVNKIDNEHRSELDTIAALLSVKVNCMADTHSYEPASSLKSQVVYSKQPKLGLTQEFVVDCAHALWVVRSIKRLV